MTVWRIEPIADLPQVTLDSWTVFEVPLYGESQPWTKHFVGYSREGRQGQVSSPIEQFDPTTRCGISQSGRVYQLGGRPGSNGDARYVWERWKTINSIKNSANHWAFKAFGPRLSSAMPISNQMTEPISKIKMSCERPSASALPGS